MQIRLWVKLRLLLALLYEPVTPEQFIKLICFEIWVKLRLFNGPVAPE